MSKLPRQSMANLLAARRANSTNQLDWEDQDFLEPAGYLDPIPPRVQLGPRIVGYRLAAELLGDQNYSPSEWELNWNTLVECYSLFPRVFGSSALRRYEVQICTSCGTKAQHISSSHATIVCDNCSQTSCASGLAITKYHAIQRDISGAEQEDLNLWQSILLNLPIQSTKISMSS